MRKREKEMDEKARILLVDDDKGICRTLALTFGKSGYEIEAALEVGGVGLKAYSMTTGGVVHGGP